MPTLTLKNLPPELHAKLKLRAIEHRRSLNQEAISCLEQIVGAGNQAEALHPPGSQGSDAERSAWLTQSQSTLLETWENTADDVFNELLAK